MMISRQCWIPKISKGLTPGETKTNGGIEGNLITVSLNWYHVLHILSVLIDSGETDYQNTGHYSLPTVTER